MRDQFPHYSKLSDTEYKDLFSDATIVPDANVLLNLYKYPLQSRKRILSVFGKYGDRMWIPHQVALEYYRNRSETISSQVDLCHELENSIESGIRNIEKQLDEKYALHPYINNFSLIRRFESFRKEVLRELKRGSSLHPDFMSVDNIELELNKIFANKTGVPFTEEELKDIYEKGEKRYELDIPPGYKDRDKDKTDKTKTKKFGDLIIWLQMINHSKTTGQPIIFVTFDQKDDWWAKTSNGKVIGTRPELIKEMLDGGGQRFHIYRLDSFIKYSINYFKIKTKVNVVEQLRQQAENIERKESGMEQSGVVNQGSSLLSEYLGTYIGTAESPLNSIPSLSPSDLTVASFGTLSPSQSISASPSPSQAIGEEDIILSRPPETVKKKGNI